ncbi:hypothetical protein AKO1_008570 [Acrasis kona]|uniref:Uncharacterized protein n=1 Tax=Acrasis kona TaxID=1008807 RepID=A0AAW2YMM8_9EUKA
MSFSKVYPEDTEILYVLSRLKRNPLNDAEILRLQQLIQENDSSDKNESASLDYDSNKKQSLKKPAQNTKKLFWENTIDPFWYLTKGPFIIFPTSMIPHLQIKDFVEYYRAYPNLHWSKYPRLFRAILARLTPIERHNILNLIREQNESREFKLNLYRKYSSGVTKRIGLFNVITDVYKFLRNIIFILFGFHENSSLEKNNVHERVSAAVHLAKYYFARMFLSFG